MARLRAGRNRRLAQAAANKLDGADGVRDRLCAVDYEPIMIDYEPSPVHCSLTVGGIKPTMLC